MNFQQYFSLDLEFITTVVCSLQPTLAQSKSNRMEDTMTTNEREPWTFSIEDLAHLLTNPKRFVLFGHFDTPTALTHCPIAPVYYFLWQTVAKSVTPQIRFGLISFPTIIFFIVLYCAASKIIYSFDRCMSNLTSVEFQICSTISQSHMNWKLTRAEKKSTKWTVKGGPVPLPSFKITSQPHINHALQWMMN